MESEIQTFLFLLTNMDIFKLTTTDHWSGSCTVPYQQRFKYSDYKWNIPQLKRKKLSTKVADKINWFHNVKEKFTYRYSSGFKKTTINVVADSDDLKYEVDRILNNLRKFNTCLFWSTANKYKDCVDYTIEFPYITWQEIDSMWNMKTKKEKISSLSTYVKSFNIYTPNEKALKWPIQFDVTISEAPEDKYELFNHLWFCGSCQHRESRNWNAQWYFDLFLNWALLYAEFRCDGKFEWRLFIRIVYDKDGNQYLALDRTYYWSTLSSRQALAIEKVVQALTEQWYKVLDNRWNRCFEWMRHLDWKFLTSPRPVHPRRGACYYHNSWWSARTQDDMMYDTYSNAYLYEKK